MSEQAKLGNFPGKIDGRDAVHIAIVPMVTGEPLKPGSWVALRDGKLVSSERLPAIGIVDPFFEPHFVQDHFDGCIPEGCTVWLLLTPGSTTGLRHVWEHPFFQKVPTDMDSKPLNIEAPDKAASMEWLKRYVAKHCPYYAEGVKGYEDGVDIQPDADGGVSRFIHRAIVEKEIFYSGTDLHGPNEVEDAEELYRHLSVVSGLNINRHYFTGFGCSC